MYVTDYTVCLTVISELHKIYLKEMTNGNLCQVSEGSGQEIRGRRGTK